MGADIRLLRLDLVGGGAARIILEYQLDHGGDASGTKAFSGAIAKINIGRSDYVVTTNPFLGRRMRLPIFLALHKKSPSTNWWGRGGQVSRPAIERQSDRHTAAEGSK